MSTNAQRDVVIVGAGVVGCAIARELARLDLKTTLLEAASDVAAATSKANTAILHTGFDARPGSLEARLVPRGYELLSDYARTAGIPLERVGALLVAWNDAELAQFPEIVAAANSNGYSAIRQISGDELYAREPNLGAGARGALEVPDEGIICPFTTPLAYVTEAVTWGCELRRGTRVTGLRRERDQWVVSTSAGELRTDYLINAAGLYSDQIDRLAGYSSFTVTPRRGELIVYDKLAGDVVKSIILGVPTPSTKGVLVSPTVFGNVMVGPTAVDIDDRADTSSTAEGLRYVSTQARRIAPSLAEQEVTAIYVGLRSATEHRDYQISFHAEESYACVGGIRSTGLTASLAIAEYVREQLERSGLRADPKPDLEPVRMPNIGERSPRPYADAAAIARDPAYGELVCFCERVSLGEIRDALASTVPPADLGGIRRRTRACMGRCQGFYCAAHVTELLREAEAIRE